VTDLHATSAYDYDDANRLSGVDGVSQIYDPNPLLRCGDYAVTCSTMA
jgi:hypothetical protein